MDMKALKVCVLSDVDFTIVDVKEDAEVTIVIAVDKGQTITKNLQEVKESASNVVHIKKPISTEHRVNELMLKCNVPNHIKGYKYLLSAITLGIENPEILGAITKGVYQSVATKHDTTPSKVERAIRHAIEKTFINNNEFFREILHCERIVKPTNSSFISTLVNHLTYNGDEYKAV
ncbi:Stage 0 sporulation protein A [compost metagenome]